ncbi:hypothetical protein [Algoriphagus mannitolivorans]|uniref:hypothetical protein n=1 Tax=Algoriphagus mannitolivorans TaxID=226504 RepID=UPI0004015819|nr:hypothetical protein [Algoriphagus mannitolivorans]
MNFFQKVQGKSRAIFRKSKNKAYGIIDYFFPIQTKELAGKRIFSLGYAYPDELFVENIPEKNTIWAEVIPGLTETYRFDQEDEYYRMYQKARFAFTWKKGGWDCLRHYEIIANGCLPVFRGIENCPKGTLEHFPKELLQEINEKLLPWKGTKTQESEYQRLSVELLAYSKNHLSCSGLGRSVFKMFGLEKAPSILLLTCDPRPNYSREFAFIGLNKEAKKSGGICISYPRLNAVYEDFPKEKASQLYGRGFGYTRKIEAQAGESQQDWDDDKIRKSILDKNWDLVLYGKVGLDEGVLGSLPNLPFWSEVSSVYSKNQIGFLYGGDHSHNLSERSSPYTRHLLSHSKHGICLVRELELP